VGDVASEPATASNGGFYVADDGPGIAEEDREDVFDSGFSTSDDGTGLGLSIVRTIAEAHGWEVAVTESETGGVPDDQRESGARETTPPGARFEFTQVQRPES
jgi:signal transduction histidine kinase